MQNFDTSCRGGASRRHPGFFYFLISILCVLTFVVGFTKGYSVGTDEGRHEIFEQIITSATADVPQAASTEEDDSTYHTQPTTTVQLTNDNEAIVYDALEQSILNQDTVCTFTLPSASAVGTGRVIEISKMVQNNPEFFWVDAITWMRWEDDGEGNRTYTINITYNMDASQVPFIAKQVEIAIDDILKNADCQNILEASQFVNRWLSQNVRYVYDKTSLFDAQYSSIVGPLLEHEAICSGYAKLYCLLMSRLGYETAYCLGHAENGVYHAWNAIRTEHGVLYTDSTFNATSDSYEKWLNVPRSKLDGRQEEKKYWYVPNDNAS